MSNSADGARRTRRSGSFAPYALALALLGTGALAVDDFDRGEALYENHCGECHAATVHVRDARIVRSREELHGWVAAWSAHAKLDWKAEDVESVTSYLSRRFYRFTR